MYEFTIEYISDFHERKLLFIDQSYYNDFTGEKYIPMIDWVIDKKGNCPVDYVARYENMQNDLDKIYNKLANIKK